MLTDDLPWPELGNVSRGATRGNQGQKGVLGPPDREGRCILQLRVQPGVLAVRLNRKASDWYRTLDGEVNRALKLTKTYWRKARRRQDYDARADQDHMELHEWLQQLKDKTMSHLELLMQKGDIQGPPYAMPDEIELSFLRKFIERHNLGLPHNPRLRKSVGDSGSDLRGDSAHSVTPEPSDRGYASDLMDHSGRDNASDGSSTRLVHSSRTSISPTVRDGDSLTNEANSSRMTLQSARATLARAQKETQEAFLRYNSCLEAERLARQEVNAAEKRRDHIMSVLLSRNQPLPGSSDSSLPKSSHQSESIGSRSRGSSVSEEGRRSPSRYHVEAAQHLSEFRHAAESLRSSRPLVKSTEWQETDGHGVYSSDDTAVQLEEPSRKHSRSWERGQLQDGQYSCEDLTSLPPRKRVHHMMSSFDVLNNIALSSQNIAMAS